MPSTIIFIEKFYEIDEFSTFARPCGNQRELLHNCKLQLFAYRLYSRRFIYPGHLFLIHFDNVFMIVLAAN